MLWIFPFCKKIIASLSRDFELLFIVYHLRDIFNGEAQS